MNSIGDHFEQRKGLNKPELILLGSVFLLSVFGLAMSYINLHWFEDVYLHEDSLIENLTLVPLLTAIIVSIAYLATLSAHRSWFFTVFVLFALLFSIFLAGEEISWGQRIFNIESSGFFKENNAQKETNLHNLVINGQKVNKLVFSLMLFICVCLYLAVLPVVYRKSNKIRRWTDRAGIPVPHTNEIAAAALLFLITEIIPSPKSAELREMGITGIFLLILLYPHNLHVFRGKTTATKVVKEPYYLLQHSAATVQYLSGYISAHIKHKKHTN